MRELIKAPGICIAMLSALLISSCAVPSASAKQAAAVRPSYPEAARRQGIEGRVVALIEVDASGRVTGVKIISSAHELLSQAVIATFMKLRFAPDLKDGVPTGFLVQQAVTFRLSDPDGPQLTR